MRSCDERSPFVLGVGGRVAVDEVRKVLSRLTTSGSQLERVTSRVPSWLRSHHHLPSGRVRRHGACFVCATDGDCRRLPITARHSTCISHNKEIHLPKSRLDFHASALPRTSGSSPTAEPSERIATLSRCSRSFPVCHVRLSPQSSLFVPSRSGACTQCRTGVDAP